MFIRSHEEWRGEVAARPCAAADHPAPADKSDSMHQDSGTRMAWVGFGLDFGGGVPRRCGCYFSASRTVQRTQDAIPATRVPTPHSSNACQPLVLPVLCNVDGA